MSLQDAWHAALQVRLIRGATETEGSDDDTEDESFHCGRSYCNCACSRFCWASQRRGDEQGFEFRHSSKPQFTDWERRRVQSRERAAACYRPADAVVPNNGLASG